MDGPAELGAEHLEATHRRGEVSRGGGKPTAYLTTPSDELARPTD